VEGERPATPRAAPTRLPCTSAGFAELSAAILHSGVALRFRAQGGSMVPLVRDGDVVTVQPANPAQVRVGDLALCCTAADRVVVHRVIRKEAGGEGFRFVVQGDAVSQPDGWIPAAQLYGRVLALERDGTRIDVDRPLMRFLSALAVLRSRWNLGRGSRFRRARRLVKRLPGLSKYLA
jgi:hypothetical protein